MGDRYTLNPKCAYCGEKNFDIWYAPTCDVMTFICTKCKKENFITFTLDFKVKKIEDLELDDVYMAISGTSTMMEESQIKRMADEIFKRLKK